MQVLGCETKSFCAKHHAVPNPWVGRAVLREDPHPRRARRCPTASGFGAAYLDAPVRCSVTIEQTGRQTHHLTPGLSARGLALAPGGSARQRKLLFYVDMATRESCIMGPARDSWKRSRTGGQPGHEPRRIMCKSFFRNDLSNSQARRRRLPLHTGGPRVAKTEAGKKPTKKKARFFWVSLRFRLTFIGQSGTLVMSVR